MVVVSNEPFEIEQPAVFHRKTEDCNNSEKSDAFRNDIRSSLTLEVLIPNSPKGVLELLIEGIEKQNIVTVKQCIYNLDQRLDQINALTIFTSLSKYVASTNNNYEPSAPPLDPNSNWLQDLVLSLRHNSLVMIDRHADFILKQTEILHINYHDLLNIMERDTLQVSNEATVYVTGYKWAIEECHRRSLDESDLSNLRNVLQRLQYTPRYGLMTKHKFTSKIIESIPGPTRSGVLNEKDWRLIKFYLEDKAKNRPVKDLPYKWSMPRVTYRNNPKRHSSTCSSPAALRQNKTACERCIINFLSCWTAVFD